MIRSSEGGKAGTTTGGAHKTAFRALSEHTRRHS